MAQTTKRVRQRIEQKRNRQRQRQSRRRLSLISLFATSIVVVLPAILYSFFAWSTINETFQVVPTYEEAVQNFLSTAPNQIAPQFLARDQAGEPVLLIQSSESSNNIRWVQANELNSQTLNGVYALSPDIFIKPTGPNSPNLNSIIANRFFSNQTGETLSPLTPIAQSLLAQAGQRGTGLEVQLVIAELQASWTAEELATWLLNSSYYGNQQFGLAAAASFYYDRVGTQLTLPESAMLLGILDNPNINPVDNPAGAKLRQEAVLEEMLRQNFITQEQFIAARFTPLDVSQNTFVDQPNLILNRLLNSRLENLFSADEIANRQLNVVTTIDPALQQVTDCLSEYYHNYLSGLGLTGSADCPEAVEFATQDYFPSSNIRPVDSLLLVIINPLTGEILALSGAGEIADLPLDSPQNPGGQLELGSVFYPFIYTSALSQGHALSSMVIDIASPESETPTGSGPIFLEEAILSGSPDAAADVIEWVGQSNIFTLANELGVRSLERSSSIYSPLNSTADVQAGFLDIAQAYAVLANGGVQPNEQANLPIVIQQVEDERGDILFEQQSGTDRPILPSEIAWLVNQSITSTPLGDGQPFAIVQPSTAVQNGEWTIGYTPNRLVAVWAGSTQPSGTAQQTGQPVTLPLWQHVTEISTRSTPVSTWPVPSNIVRLNVCWPSGLQPNGLCPTREGLFVSGTEPVQFDNMFQSFLVNNQTGNLATSSTPANLIEEVTYQVFPEEAQAWAAANGFEAPPADYDPINVNGRALGFEVTMPASFTAVSRANTIQLNLDDINEFESFRIAFYEGLSPGRIEVVIDGVSPPSNRRTLSIPILLSDSVDGLITLLITGFRPDGSISELALPVSVE